MKRVLTVGCNIPGGFGEYVDLGSQVSLFDADFVLFEPSLDYWRYSHGSLYQGKQTLTETGSFEAIETIEYWRKELTAYLNSGKQSSR